MCRSADISGEITCGPAARGLTWPSPGWGCRLPKLGDGPFAMARTAMTMSINNLRGLFMGAKTCAAIPSPPTLCQIFLFPHAIDIA
jgi:hypothetical protein